jgi:predicted PurR-regulated permease PerM
MVLGVLGTPRACTSGMHACTPEGGRQAWVGKGLFVIALLVLLKAAEPLLVPVAIAILLTFVLMTPMRRLRRAGLPQALAAAVLVGALLGCTGLLGAMLAGPAAQWWERAPSTVSQLVAQIDRLRAAIPLIAPPPMPGRSGPRAAQQPQQPAPADPLRDRLTSEGLSLTRVLLAHLLSFALATAATVILLFFLLASEQWLLSRAVEALPNRRSRVRVVGGVRAAQREIGRFLGAMAIINVGVGIATTGAMTYIGMPNPALWGTLCAALNFIPYIGPLVAASLLLLAGITSFGAAEMMLAPAAAFIAIHAIESNLIAPWFVGRRLRLSTLSVFLSVLFWGWMWGIAGAVVAVPVLVGLRAICERNRRWQIVCVFLGNDHERAPSVQALLREAPPAAAPAVAAGKPYR